MASDIEDPEVFDRIVKAGLADEGLLREMVIAWRRWAEDPNAFYSSTWCEAVGWKI